MNHNLILFITGLLFCCLPNISKGQVADAGTYAFDQVNVILMNENKVLDNQTIIIRNGIISEIGKAGEINIPEDAKIIDGKGKYMIPGLVDAHVHLRHTNKEALIRYLAAGITTVRDMNGRPFLLEWRKEIKRGQLLGPTLFVASPTIGNFSSPKEGYPTPETTQQADSLVREFKQQGYDWIKVWSFVPRDIYFALIKAAEKYEIPIGGHPPLGIMKSIEHLLGYVDPIMTEKAKKLDEQDMRGVFHAVEIKEEKLPALARKTNEAGVYNCPTILFFDHSVPTERVREAWEKPVLRKLGHENRVKIVRALHKAGAPLVLCTDSDAGDDLPASSIYEEIGNMREAGLSPYEVLKAATVKASNLLNSSKFGTIEEGKRADLLLLEGNPLENIDFVRQKIGVMVRGNWITKQNFKRILED